VYIFTFIYNYGIIYIEAPIDRRQTRKATNESKEHQDRRQVRRIGLVRKQAKMRGNQARQKDGRGHGHQVP
jgi:hypothetical protein